MFPEHSQLPADGETSLKNPGAKPRQQSRRWVEIDTRVFSEDKERRGEEKVLL